MKKIMRNKINKNKKKKNKRKKHRGLLNRYNKMLKYSNSRKCLLRNPN